MSFISQQFFLIVIFTIILYFLFPKKFRWVVLLVSSCFFYYKSAGIYASVIVLVTTAIVYQAAMFIDKSQDDRKKKHLYMTAGAVIALGILAVIKINRHLGLLSWIIMPMGISYYTFSLVGYLVDVYARKGPVEKNYLKLLLYTVYFPKIIQGPISKFREIGPHLIEGHSFDFDRMCLGLQRILWGYFKKIVITERVLMISSNVFGDFNNYDGGGAVLLVVTFFAVIGHYCDFSGYMDIVIGISQILGIELDENFRQPFFSRTAAEFWRRWHITLGTWFKDYVYMPLVINPKLIRIGKWTRTHFGKRAGKSVITVISLAIVWFLTGLWHGTGYNYIIWGCYWGTIIIISNVFEPEFKKLTGLLHIKTEARDWEIFQMIRTFCFFVLGLLISTYIGVLNLKAYARFVIKRFQFAKLGFTTFTDLGLEPVNLFVLVFAILLLWFIETKQVDGSVRGKIAELNAVTRWAIYALGLLIVFFLGIYGPGYSTSGFEYAVF